MAKTIFHYPKPQAVNPIQIQSAGSSAQTKANPHATQTADTNSANDSITDKEHAPDLSNAYLAVPGTALGGGWSRPPHPRRSAAFEVPRFSELKPQLRVLVSCTYGLRILRY